MQKKTNTQRIKRIHQLAEEHFGINTVRFVGLKYEKKIGFIAKIKFYEEVQISSIYESADDSTIALKKLKDRIKRIIKRYNSI